MHGPLPSTVRAQDSGHDLRETLGAASFLGVALALVLAGRACLCGGGGGKAGCLRLLAPEAAGGMGGVLGLSLGAKALYTSGLAKIISASASVSDHPLIGLNGRHAEPEGPVGLNDLLK